MIRFPFALRPVPEIQPWGGDEPMLHWFGLTDGWYWIELDGVELLRYATPAGSEPVDYQVVRLWEDLLDLLPAVLEPVPADLVDFLGSDPGDWSGPAEPDCDVAISWHQGHRLDLGYLVDAPRFTLCRSVEDARDAVTIGWRHRPESEIRFTAPAVGHRTVPTEAFLAAVRELDRDLFAAMERRVAQLERVGPPAGVHVDVGRLRHEQRERATWLASALRHPPSTDWAAVRAGATKLLA